MARWQTIICTGRDPLTTGWSSTATAPGPGGFHFDPTGRWIKRAVEVQQGQRLQSSPNATLTTAGSPAGDYVSAPRPAARPGVTTPGGFVVVRRRVITWIASRTRAHSRAADKRPRAATSAAAGFRTSVGRRGPGSPAEIGGLVRRRAGGRWAAGARKGRSTRTSRTPLAKSLDPAATVSGERSS